MAIEYPIWEQVNVNAGTLQKPVVGQTITAAATIAPTYHVHHVTGSTPIVNITVPWTDFNGGPIVLIADSAISWTAAGNIAAAGSVTQPGQILLLFYDPVAAKWYINVGSGPGASGASTLYNVRSSQLIAVINTGYTHLPAVPGLKWRVVDYYMTATGANAAGATSVDINGTQSASGVALFAVPVATLTRGTVTKPNSANVVPLTDGAATAQCDANTAITVKSTGTLTTSTAVVTCITAALEA